jgi:hypothetical protein
VGSDGGGTEEQPRALASGRGGLRCWCGAWAVSRGSGRGQRGGPRWLSDGEQGDAGAVKRAEEEERGGCSFYSCQRRWEEGDVVAATVGEAKRRRPWSKGCRCGWAPLFGQGP